MTPPQAAIESEFLPENWKKSIVDTDGRWIDVPDSRTWGLE
ncbi:MAG: hypothetical protein ABFD85_13260 [Phycisphaerae bacterium]